MPRPSRREETREQLLDAGVAMLMNQGYHATGIKALVDAVRVPKGSFYNYFVSKEDFGARAVEHYIEPFIERLSASLDAPGVDARTAMHNYFNALIADSEARAFEGGCLLGNLLGEIGDTSDVCRRALNEAVRRYRDQMKRGLETAQAEGTIRRDLSAEAMADVLFDAWQGALLRMRVERSVAPLRACCAYLLNDFFAP